MKNFNILLTVMLLVFISTQAWATDIPPKTPIDGGLSVLLLAGGAYGLKKIKDLRKS
jgi:hypothetical protein